MTQNDRESQHRLRILTHAEEAGHVGQTCRYFGIGRTSFYRWKATLDRHGEAGLVRKKLIPKNPKNNTASLGVRVLVAGCPFLLPNTPVSFLGILDSSNSRFIPRSV
jgi:hypothetical protein